MVAIALLFMAEEDAFWCLVYIIEHLMPAEYYSRDKQLIGAQVDQVFNVHYFFFFFIIFFIIPWLLTLGLVA